MIEEIYEEKLKELELTAVKTRELIIETLLEAGSGHSAGPMGMADIFTAFLFSHPKPRSKKIQTGKIGID